MCIRDSDYTELLLPDGLLREDSVLGVMIREIPEEDWKEQVQIIGWLYQYYISEQKDEVFSRPRSKKIQKKDIPAATQLFTPDWIVRYMVENSLGRLWIEGHPDEELKTNWKYYLEEAEQEKEVQEKLEEIKKEYAETVSYTHLDVYKRQARDQADPAHGSAGDLPHEAVRVRSLRGVALWRARPRQEGCRQARGREQRGSGPRPSLAPGPGARLQG